MTEDFFTGLAYEVIFFLFGIIIERFFRVSDKLRKTVGYLMNDKISATIKVRLNDKGRTPTDFGKSFLSKFNQSKTTLSRIESSARKYGFTDNRLVYVFEKFDTNQVIFTTSQIETPMRDISNEINDVFGKLEEVVKDVGSIDQISIELKLPEYWKTIKLDAPKCYELTSYEIKLKDNQQQSSISVYMNLTRISNGSMSKIQNTIGNSIGTLKAIWLN